MNNKLTQLQAEMNTLLQRLMSRGLLTQAVYNKLCSEYAVHFTKLLSTYGTKQSVSFRLLFEYELPTTASFLHNVTYEEVRDSVNFASRSI